MACALLPRSRPQYLRKRRLEMEEMLFDADDGDDAPPAPCADGDEDAPPPLDEGDEEEGDTPAPEDGAAPAGALCA